MPDIVALLADLRALLTGAIMTMLPQPQAALLEGILLGGGRSLPPETWDAFKVTGLLHVVAVSGTNVALVIAAIDGMLFWLPRRWRLVPAALLVAAFTILAGAGASAVRAAIMGVLSLLALQLGRAADRRRMIAAAFIIMVAFEPRYLIEDAGFQLSFLAVIGIAEIGPLLDPLLKRVPKTFGIRECLLMTGAAQLSASPWGTHLFGGFSLIAPLANLLIAPAIPLAMLTGCLALLAHFVSPILSQLLALVSWLFLGWMTGWAESLAQVPYANLNIQPSLNQTVAYYTVLIAVVALLQNKDFKSFFASQLFRFCGCSNHMTKPEAKKRRSGKAQTTTDRPKPSGLGTSPAPSPSAPAPCS